MQSGLRCLPSAVNSARCWARLSGRCSRGWGFAGGAGGGGVFVVALIVLYFCLPAAQHSKQALNIVPRWTTFRQPRFVAFIIAYSSWLLSYNQLYLALPVEIQRAGGNEKDPAPVYAGLCADHHLAASAGPLCTTRGRGENFAGGLLLLSASFASVAVFAPTVPPEGWLRLLPSVCFVALLTLGQMLLVPSAKDLVPRFAEESTLGAHYGALATAGGVAVLLGNLLFGSLLDRALVPSPQAMSPAAAGPVPAMQRDRHEDHLSPFHTLRRLLFGRYFSGNSGTGRRSSSRWRTVRMG